MKYLVLLFAVVGCVSEQEKEISLYKTEKELLYQTSYLDQKTGDLFSLFSEYTQFKWRLKMVKMTTEGEISTPMQLMGDFVCKQYLQNFVINGAENGKDLYVIGKCVDKNYFELYFIESHDGGLTWSEPILPWQKGKIDRFSRESPQLLVHPSGALTLFYYKSENGITMTKRTPGSAEWSEEIVLETKICQPDMYSDYLRAFLVSEENMKPKIVIGYRCYKIYEVIIAETENGVDWTDYSLPELKVNYQRLFAMEMNPQTGRIFVSGTMKHDTFHLVGLFEYKYKGKFEKLGSYPFLDLKDEKLFSFSVANLPCLVQLLQQNTYEDNKEANLQLIHPYAPYKRSTLPLPIFGKSSLRVNFYFFKSFLFAIGENYTKEIFARKMKL